MRWPAYQPKSFLREQIAAVAADETQDGGEDMVLIIGRFGERGVAFFPYQGKTDPSAKVGFSLLGRNVSNSHTNLCRDDAVDLVDLLVSEYDMTVTTQRVTRTVVTIE